MPWLLVAIGRVRSRSPAEIEEFHTSRTVRRVGYQYISRIEISVYQAGFVSGCKTCGRLARNVEGNRNRYLAVACEGLVQRLPFDVFERREQVAVSTFAEIVDSKNVRMRNVGRSFCHVGKARGRQRVRGDLGPHHLQDHRPLGEGVTAAVKITQFTRMQQRIDSILVREQFSCDLFSHPVLERSGTVPGCK
jgi:hypothetical protein